ncbi:MAG: DUF4956 domain-containing protein [Clostridia bacterium]|nr:DUF4956 domain-containing protein [Clostridia bacterium]
MFESIFENSIAGSLSYTTALICIVASCVLGGIISLVHMKTTKCSKNFAITIAVLPALVQIVIMMVNGNLGTSVAILGSFGLIRFRSMQGNSKEILSVFFAMAIGLAVGMGHIAFATFITIIISLLLLIYSKIKIGRDVENMRRLKVLIPENLNYVEVFDEVFTKYTKSNTLEKLKTTNMGSMYELNYIVELKSGINEKEFLDELRVRNGNLNILLARESDGEEQL